MTPNPIVSITPNPALDLSGMVQQIIPDEKNYVHDEKLDPGGNAINAARIIHRMNVPVTVSGFLGGGIGKELKDLIAAEGLNHQFIEIRKSTRVCVTVSNRNTHHQTRLSFPGPQIATDEFERLERFLETLLEGTLVVIGGSLPPGVNARNLSDLIKAAQKRKCECIVDVPGSILRELYQESDMGPLLIKPNLLELGEFFGHKVTSLKEVVHAVRPILDKTPLVCVSSVEGGAALITPKGAWFGRIPKVRVKTSVGAGDSMVGSMCAVLHQWKFKDRDDKGFYEAVNDKGGDLLRWGLAAACATLTVTGTQLGERADIEKYYSQIEIEKTHELSRKGGPLS
ncbi:MAG: hypothetical protein CL678_06695 [Bdellovibrionaceae bacterium]|nr:hypothetical protein [Pseudobdellovibrionaceae bacterium]|tara:strand:- start:344 stop:1366 length:1023 start_codon:yes stop_codon:yes gene_type:complete